MKVMLDSRIFQENGHFCRVELWKVTEGVD